MQPCQENRPNTTHSNLTTTHYLEILKEYGKVKVVYHGWKSEFIIGNIDFVAQNIQIRKMHRFKDEQ